MAFSKGIWNIYQLMDEYSVLIPALQRNYVHGRDGDAHAQEVREHFVNSILNSPREGMHLDVVYGVVSVDKVKVLTPIDGQQRLTSLWLVAVYCAQKCSRKRDKGSESNGVLCDPDVVKILGALSRFSYEARPIASTFCRWLTSSCQFDKFEKQLNLARRQWGEDPTVRAMCTTLELVAEKLSEPDAIDDVARAVLGMSEHKVTFDFRGVPGDPTDLYVKINARGRTLTQWENLKGKFAEVLCGDEKEKFEKEIEDLSVQYFKWAKGSNTDNSESAKSLLPDDAFFALCGRVTDYLLRTYCDKRDEHCELEVPATWIQPNSNLSKLAVAEIQDIPYTPVEEFHLERFAKYTSLPLLRMIRWALLHPEVCFRYWDSRRTIPQAVFAPKNENERDFSLFLYDYFCRYDDGNGLEVNDYRALRLVANILSDNVPRNSVQQIKSKDYSAAHQFNRLGYLKMFIGKSSGLYCKDIDVAADEKMQIREEVAKAEIYESGTEATNLLVKLEELMQGRVRLALFDLKKDNCGHEKNLVEFTKRAGRLCMLLEEWKERIDCRKELLKKLIQAHPWDVPSGVRVEISFADKVYQAALRKDALDVWLQESLVDQTELDPKSWYVNLEKERKWDWGIGNWARDWRDGVIDFISGENGLGGTYTIENAKDLHVMWHNASGAYYLYTGTNNNYSYPVGDYRIEFYKSDSEFRTALRILGVKDGWMTHAGEIRVPCEDIPGLELEFDFLHNGCRVQISRDERVCRSFVGLTQINSIGWVRFIANAFEIAQREDLDLSCDWQPSWQDDLFKTGPGDDGLKYLMQNPSRAAQVIVDNFQGESGLRSTFVYDEEDCMIAVLPLEDVMIDSEAYEIGFDVDFSDLSTVGISFFFRKHDRDAVYLPPCQDEFQSLLQLADARFTISEQGARLAFARDRQEVLKDFGAFIKELRSIVATVVQNRKGIEEAARKTLQVE